MGRVLCKFNSVAGNETATYTRRGMGKSYPSAGLLIKKNCPNGQFYVESTDGGTNNYYRLIDPQNYKGIDSSGPVYVWISTSYLQSPNPADVKRLGANTPSTTTPGQSQGTTTIDDIDTFQYTQGLDDQIYAYLESMKIKDLLKQNTRVFGSPFQFTNVADHRPFTDNELKGFGRKYLENIVAESPILYITPGLPDYMPDADQSTKDSIDSFIKARSSGSNLDDATLTQILNTELRYYGFISAYSEYMRYVNLLCRVCAHYMGIADRKVPGYTKTYGEFDWGRWTNINYTDQNNNNVSRVGIFEKIGGAFQDAMESTKDKIVDDIFGEYKYVKCYVDPSVSFSESSSNSTQPSQVAGLFDSLESIVKEVGFFSNGSGILSGAVDMLQSGTSTIANSATGIFDADVSAGLSKIIGNATHVISGSNVIFPELWGDSAYNKSYSFTIDLVSPYGDIESNYLNIIVPMMHLIALAMPRQTSANSFGSPFLVKLFAKGWFSCDLGIVESISIEKSPDSWNVHGLPNEVKVNMSVKDLYTSLSVSKASTPGLFFSNQGLIEFLAVTCGINITQGDIGLKIETIISTFVESLFDIPSNMYDDVIQSIRNSVEGWFKITR